MLALFTARRTSPERESINIPRRQKANMNLLLQAYEDSPLIIDAAGWAVLLGSLVLTIGWLWYLYR